MLKITDKDYYLPIVEALVPIKIMSTGRTNPMLINGVDTSTGIKADYVVKFKKGAEMSIRSSCNELIALFIGKELSLNVVEPALINISKEFINTLQNNDNYKIALDSEGLNYGCKFAGPGFLEFIKNQQLTDNQYYQAQNIFAFDIFISNVDRREGKENMLTNGTDIVIFDHELAFSFIYEIFRNPTPWIIRDADKDWVSKHYFYRAIRNAKFNFDNFVNSLDAINDAFWDKVYNLIPKDWINGDMDKLKDNLNSLVLNRSIFLQELNKVFA